MKAGTKGILTVLHVVSWIIFIGLCVRAGAIMYTAFVSLYINPGGSKNLYSGLNLTSLYDFSITYYMVITSLIIVITALKALIFYQVIKIFLKINYVTPFSPQIASLISMVGYISLGVGILTKLTNGYCNWLSKKGVNFPDMSNVLGAGTEFLLFAGVIVFIAQVFKRGIEMQTENELTV